MGVSPPQMLPKRSSNASTLVQSKSQVRRPLRYGATGVQSHPILVTVNACRLWPTSAPKRRPAIDPKRTFTTLFYSNSRNTTAVLSSGSPWMKESPVKTATRHSLFHAHITSLFLEWKSAPPPLYGEFDWPNKSRALEHCQSREEEGLYSKQTCLCSLLGPNGTDFAL